MNRTHTDCGSKNIQAFRILKMGELFIILTTYSMMLYCNSICYNRLGVDEKQRRIPVSSVGHYTEKTQAVDLCGLYSKIHGTWVSEIKT